ncbi:MAG: ABC transporter permease [Firmicutes bacterium]|nr:ABC transporter permease [Bacillota bacterium]
MSRSFLHYIAQRIVQCILVIFVGITITFVIPRLSPTDPVETAVNRAIMVGQFSHPEAVRQMKEALIKLYGLDGTLLQQYLRFWKGLFSGDLGPSLSSFPKPVMSLIRGSLPWTTGLLLVSAIISWVIGNTLGSLAGYYRDQRWAHILGICAMALHPIPYYIMAFVLVVLLAYILPIFPIGGAVDIGLKPSFDWNYVASLLRHAILPSLSLLLVGVGGWFVGMRALVTNVVAEDYVTYAKYAGVPDRTVMYQYVMKNALLPQVTGLAMQIGLIFNGALITEYVFSYPGLGYLAYNAIFTGDYSLIMGIAIFSIVGVSVAVLLIDLAYPLFDPRVRYQ